MQLHAQACVHWWKYTTHKLYYDKFHLEFEPLELVQLRDEITWSRLINGNWKESMIDHIC